MIVVDGDLLLHRALHVAESAALTRSVDGMPTGGALNVLSGVQRALEAFKSERAVVVFDGARSVRRTTLYPGYKDRSAKAKTPEEQVAVEKHTTLFKHQRMLLKGILPFFGCRVCVPPTKEGDDTIARIAHHLVASGQVGDVCIVSDDRDLWQLVSERVSVYRPGAAYAGKTDSFVSEQNFVQMAGVTSRERFLLRKAITGDASDTITGVEGVGEKTATPIVGQVPTAVIAEGDSRKTAEALALVASVTSSARTKRLATPEAQQIVERNLELMDLRREPWTEEEDAFVRQKVFDGVVSFDRAQALRVCSALEYQKILSSWSYWLQPFKFLG